MNLREAKFQQYVLADIERLKGRYDPTAFQVMVRQYGAVETAKRLLADPRSTSYGFGKLWELGALDSSIEYATCLPWFRPLFTDDQIETAERRLADHGFPIQERLARAVGSPPDWAVDSALTDEDER